MPKHKSVLLLFQLIICSLAFVSGQKNVCKDPSKEEPMFDSLAIFIVDSMRIDCLPTIGSANAVPKWPFLEELAKTNGIVLKTLVETPTITAPRIEALLSGQNPSFVDSLYDFNAKRLSRDNIIQRLYNKPQFRTIYSYGHHVWENFFPKSEKLFEKILITSSANVNDLDSDDEMIANEIQKDVKIEKNLNVLIAQWPGIDRIGHTHGLNWSLIDRKLKYYDHIGRRIIEDWNNKNRTGLFVLTSVHGMTDWGGHGAGTYYEVNTPLLMVSNRPTAKKSFKTQSYRQIDVPVTLAELFHIGIPEKSRGKLITNVLQRFGMDSGSILCSQKRTVESLHESLDYNKRLEKSTLFEAHFRPELVNMYRLHEESIKDPSKANSAMEAYDVYLEHLQTTYAIRGNSGYFSQTLLVTAILLLSSIVLHLFRKEYNGYSVLFYRKICRQNCSGMKENSDEKSSFLEIENQKSNDCQKSIPTPNWFESKTAKASILLLFFARFASLGSPNFMDHEALFWNYSGQILIGFVILFNRLNFKNGIHHSRASNLYTILIFIVYRYILTQWRIIIPNDFWEKTDQSFAQDDIYSWLEHLRDSNFGLDAFLFVLSILILASQAQLYIKSNSLYRIFTILYALVFVFRDQTLTISPVLPFKMLKKDPLHPIFFSVFVYVVLLILLLSFGLPFFIRKRFSFLHCYRLTFLFQAWILISSVIIDPKLLPAFVLHVLIEEQINHIFSENFGNSHGKGEFFRLSSYLLFAYSSFYQLGNSNSLTTLTIPACFVGQQKFFPLPCIFFFTIVAMYSGFLFWLLALIIRLNQPTHIIAQQYQISSPSLQWNQKESVLTSIIQLGFIWSLCNLGMSLAAAFTLQNHLLIWSAILPKFLYELSFTILSVIVWTLLWCGALSFRNKRAMVL